MVDWDVHHGNGTQSVFYDDPGVLTVSIHQDGVFPRNSGYISETGEGRGIGYNINIPLPPGCGDGAYRAAFERVVLPALHAYRPQAIFVACGFDAGMNDPLARMMLVPNPSADDRRDAAGARDLCGGRSSWRMKAAITLRPFPSLPCGFRGLVGERAPIENPMSALSQHFRNGAATAPGILCRGCAPRRTIPRVAQVTNLIRRIAVFLQHFAGEIKAIP